ncbi:hypothetical protein Lser_V15G42864 [Lactuca serriola]
MNGRGKDTPAIGIDLGTTYSCVAVWKHDHIQIIPNDQGNRTTPSCVAFVNGERLIGDGAKNQVAMNPANTIFDAKRLIGRRFSDSKVQDDMKLWPFKVIEGTADTPKIVVSYKGEEKEFLAEEISSMILGKMKETAESYLGKPVKNAVVTVPAYFNDSQCQATKDAGTIAGLNAVRIINEPTAASIAYGLDNKSNINGKINVLVFDLGGGTFDVSILTIAEGGTIEVKAVAGDTHLGGEDFDSHMVEHCARVFKRKWNKDLTVNKRALGRLRFACEKAKRILSCTKLTSIDIDGLHEGIDFSMNFSRAKFEELNMGYFLKCIETLETCLSDAKMEKLCVNEEFFDQKQISKSVNPDVMVYQGERARATDNHLLGEFSISGIPPAPKGCIKFKDCFEIDANGILTVTSEIISTGKTEKLTITNANGRLSKKEIEMIKDASKYKLEDQKYKNRADAFNALEDCIYNMKKKIRNMENGERLKRMKHAIADTTKWIEHDQAASVDELQCMKEHLESICMRYS